MHPGFRNLLVRKNRGVVYTVARAFASGPDAEDMIQAGFIGLIRAIELFHPCKGAFYSYAKMHVLYEIQQAARAKRGIRRGEQNQGVDAEILYGGFDVMHEDNGPRDSERRTSIVATSGGTERVEALDALASVLSELSERDGAALIAHADGATVGDVAALLRCSRSEAQATIERVIKYAREAALDLTAE